MPPKPQMQPQMKPLMKQQMRTQMARLNPQKLASQAVKMMTAPAAAAVLYTAAPAGPAAPRARREAQRRWGQRRG
jgi:hypothetical protein